MIVAEIKKEFQQRITNTVENCFLGMALLVGHRLKLFDLLHEIAPTEESGKSSEEIAASARLKERYVREWLCNMVVGRVVETDKCGVKFWLPEHRYSALSSKTPTALGFLPFVFEFAVLDEICECFKPDGPTGIPYSKYANFHARMDEVHRNSFKAHLIQTFIPSLPGIQSELEGGIRVLDIGCGSGYAMKLMAYAYPNSHFIGFDFSEEAIDRANTEVGELKNLHFQVMDACKLKPEWSDTFDFVTSFDSFHDQAYPDKECCPHLMSSRLKQGLCKSDGAKNFQLQPAYRTPWRSLLMQAFRVVTVSKCTKSLKETFRVLKPGGMYCMVEPGGTGNVYEDLHQDVPYKSFKYAASLFHCTPVSLYFEDGVGLGTMWGEKKAKQMLTETGFVDIQFSPSFVPTNTNIIARKPQGNGSKI